MKSPSICNPKGFSLIEMMVAMTIVMFLAVSGIIIGIDSFSRYNFHNEVEKEAAMLMRARSESINNIGGAEHGVYFNNADYIVLFKGSSYGNDPAHDLKIEKSKTVTYNASSCSGGQMVFSQLSGSASQACQTVLSDGIRNVTITLNNEGGIDW